MVSIIETTGAIAGLQRSVRGLEKNARHMSVAMDNLTKNMASMQQALAASGMMTAPAPPTYVQIPQRPAPFQTMTAVSQLTPLSWVYDDESDDELVSGLERNSETGDQTEEIAPAPDESGGRTAD